MIIGTFSALLAPGAIQTTGTERQMTSMFNKHGSVTATISQEIRPHLPSEIRLSNIEEFVPQEIVYNDVEIALLEKPICVLQSRMTVAVKGWGINCAHEKAYEIPREMARQFLKLHSKAQEGILTQEESTCWGYIVDRVDYARFCASRSRPIRYEGQVIERTDRCVDIEWADGTRNRLDDALAALFVLVNEGEMFTCLAKFRDNKVIEVHGVQPMGLPETKDWSWIERPA